MNMHTNRVVIVGGGFGGVRCAMQCAKRLHAGTQIALITDKPYMQYYAALYRALAGGDPSEACVPLRDLFHAKRVHVVVDPVVSIEPSARPVTRTPMTPLSSRWDPSRVSLGFPESKRMRIRCSH